MKPNVLLISTSPSFSPARLSMAFGRSGCTTEAICPPRHSLRKTRAVRKVYFYNCLAPVRSVKNAISLAKPDLVIPTDDLAASHLHDLYSRELPRGDGKNPICELIARSLGSPQNFQVVFERAAFLELAQEEGIRVPQTAVISCPEDLKKWAAAVGFPAVLKANGTSGGDGVRIVQSLEEAEGAFRTLQAPPLIAKALKRALIDQEMALLWPSLLRRRYVVNAQAFVAGREATSAIACWKGKIIASLHFEVLNKQDAGGPSTVLRWIENDDMSATAEKIARRLQLSGLHGFDFMLEAQTGNPYLIEINPRATQVGHLALGFQHDLPAALYAALAGGKVQAAPKVTDKDVIALFPQEWLRTPASEFIRSGYHDVPWAEPEFIEFCVQKWRRNGAGHSMQKRIQAFLSARRKRP